MEHWLMDNGDNGLIIDRYTIRLCYIMKERITVA